MRSVAKRESHGLRHSPTYSSWAAMKNRCSNPNNPSYKNYGARGISVCVGWANSFEAFYRDMGPRPGLEYSIERRDNSGCYEPSNCSWALPSEQSNNTRRNRYVTYRAKTMSVSQWAHQYNINPSVLSMRLLRGWSISRALSTPG
jgi:hypothetical protein